MRAVVTLLSGFFVAILVFTLVAGPIFEPVAQAVLGYEAVQQGGYASTITTTRKVLLRWGPLLILGGIVVGAVRWAISEEQLTGVRR